LTDRTLTIAPHDDTDDPDAFAGPCLVLLLECARPAASSARHDLRGVREITIGRATSRQVAREARAGRLALGVPDARMSRQHARLAFELGRWVLEDAGSKNGVTLNGERHIRAALDDGDVFELGHTLFLFVAENRPAGLAPDCDAAALCPPAPGLATFVPALSQAFADLVQIAPTAASVLLQGETGTGKELVARATHLLSQRPGPFVAANCGALPAALVESELFGYRKGAFSGANEDREGLVRSADRGTLFLDEIGDLSPPSQAALLRVLQEREVMPLGATRARPVDLKLVAATHHNLEGLVASGQFRRDLYARIAGFVVRLPPLRDRREDFGLLVAAILSRRAPDPSKLELSNEAARALWRHDWPMNVRELDNALSIALTLARGGRIELEHLPETVRAAPAAKPTAQPGGPPQEDTRQDTRRGELEALLKAHAGNVSAVARATGVSRVQVHRWFKRYGIDPSAYR
jgi:sigma-54 dependent transcriptional regulator, acetoin dehydrogenase operon transcriptional activator AcoR